MFCAGVRLKKKKMHLALHAQKEKRLLIKATQEHCSANAITILFWIHLIIRYNFQQPNIMSLKIYLCLSSNMKHKNINLPSFKKD